MPLFMDVHEKLPEGATAKDVAQAHAADVKTQEPVRSEVHEVLGRREGRKGILSLVEAPDAATAEKVYREAHGLVADRIFEVQEGS